MFNILSFLHGGWPIFIKGKYRKKQRYDLQRRGVQPSRKLCHMTQGLSKACIVCPCVCLLTTFLEISTLDVVCG